MNSVNLNNSSFMRGLSESYLADLGRVVAAWSHVEQQFDILYLSFVVMRGAPSGSLSDPKVSKLMGLSFGRRIKEFRNRLKELPVPEEIFNAVSSALDQLLTLRRERDEVAHAVWNPVIDKDMTLADNKGAALYKSWKNQKPHKNIIVNQSRLQETFERIHSLYWRLVELQLHRELRDLNR